jgi:hypothetical protein
MDESQNTDITEHRRRAAEELLASTPFKDSLRLFLKDIDPEAGPTLVRTLMGKDPEVPLAVMSTLPVVANCLFRTAMELVKLIRQYPPPLLAGMIEALLQDVDRETLSCLIREGRDLGKIIAPALSKLAGAVQEQSSAGKEPV